MKLVTDYTPLTRHNRRAFDQAVDDVLKLRRAAAPRRTGEYANSFSTNTRELKKRTKARIGSTHPGARAIEMGANVGPKKGPHMAAVGTLDEAGDEFIERYTRRLRAGW